MRSRLLSLLACGVLGLGALSLTACSDDDFGQPQPGEDMAAPGQDGGTDAATSQDAATPQDASSAQDAVVAEDAAAPEDAATEDAALGADAATP